MVMDMMWRCLEGAWRGKMEVGYGWFERLIEGLKVEIGLVLWSLKTHLSCPRCLMDVYPGQWNAKV